METLNSEPKTPTIGLRPYDLGLGKITVPRMEKPLYRDPIVIRGPL